MDHSDLELVRKQLEDYEKNRDSLIGKGRALIKLSKRVIYAVHRDDLAKAEEWVAVISDAKTELVQISSLHPGLVNEGSFRVAIQEYVEALVYYTYVKEGRIMTHAELSVAPNHYILGLCDVTGELGRRAVRAATKENYAEVIRIKDTVEEMFGALLGFDFRDNETRRKFDSIKYDLKKLEDLVLDLKLKGKI